jgi:hypothetical protein
MDRSCIHIIPSLAMQISEAAGGMAGAAILDRPQLEAE